MDTSDGYDGLDFALSEPGSIEDTRVADEAARQVNEEADTGIETAIGRFDQARSAHVVSAIGVVRVKLEDASDMAGECVIERFASVMRDPDFCVRAGTGDYVMGLSDCDMELARKRIALMLRLVEMDPSIAGKQAIFWAGIAPATAGDSLPSARTARLACDLAAFQASGHIEVIDW